MCVAANGFLRASRAYQGNSIKNTTFLMLSSKRTNFVSITKYALAKRFIYAVGQIFFAPDDRAKSMSYTHMNAVICLFNYMSGSMMEKYKTCYYPWPG